VRRAGQVCVARIGRLAMGVLLVAYALGVVIDLAIHTDKYQWDFATYYYAGQATRAGMNPYELESLSTVAGKDVGFPFAYSPVVLPAFSLLSHLPFAWAYWVYLALKVVCLGVLVWVWRTRFVADGPSLPLYLLCIFGFGGAIYADLAAGNVSVFEQVALWLALIALIQDRPIRFGILVILASLFKLTPILFAILLILPGLRRRIGAFSGTMAGFLALNGLAYLVAPGLYRDFLTTIPQLDDRGAINPSTLALLRDLGDLLTRKGLAVSPLVEWLLYGVFAVAIVAITWLVLSRRRGEDGRLPIVLVCLAFALVMPRFKNYAYILLIPPACLVLQHMVDGWAGELGLLLLLLSYTPPVPFGFGETARNLLWGYYPWLLALGLWTAQVIWMVGGRTRSRGEAGDLAPVEGTA
jgi:hypothetical protein